MSCSKLGSVFVALLAVVMAGGQGAAASAAPVPASVPAQSATRSIAVGLASLTPTAPVTRLSDFNRDRFTDLVAADKQGDLWLYPGNGAGGFKPRHQMGHGWVAMSGIASPGDVTGDGNADVVASDRSGRLWLYAGSGASSLRQRVQIGNGWSRLFFTAAANLNGAGRPDLLAIDAAGRLWLYPLQGYAHFGQPSQIGSGWRRHFVMGPGDVSGDGRADVLGLGQTGGLRLYRGDGAGHIGRGTAVSGGLGGLVAPGNWDRKAGNDLIGTDGVLGRLWLFRGNNAGAFATPVQIGHGWNNFFFIG